MKKKLLAALATGVFLVGMTGVAQALTINGTTDVGGMDLFKDKALLTTSGDAAELAWISSVIGRDAGEFIFYDDFGNASDGFTGEWTALDGQTEGEETKYAYELPEQVEYFMIKFGVGNKDAPFSHFLFQNNISLDWAVFDLVDPLYGTYLNGDVAIAVEIKNIGKASHIGGVGQPIPEPATMLLLGTGLAGLVAARRRRKAAMQS